MYRYGGKWEDKGQEGGNTYIGSGSGRKYSHRGFIASSI
jgi:hypothetical protein